MYESRRHPLAPTRRFAWRVVRHVAVASALVAGSLGGGMAGYAHVVIAIILSPIVHRTLHRFHWEGE